MFKCNRLVTAYTTEQEKRKLWDCGVVGGLYAIDDKNKQYKLIDLPFERVDFIAGLWRVQRDFDEKIQIVRGKEFILLGKIDKQEKNLFEYYKAATVGNNCYGLYSSMDPDCVVAKYDTDNGPLWAYGATLEQARAFLGIALFDKHTDLIHRAERKNIKKQKYKNLLKYKKLLKQKYNSLSRRKNILRHNSLTKQK